MKVALSRPIDSNDHQSEPIDPLPVGTYRRRADRIKDEAGDLLDEASGWAHQAWTAMKDAADWARSNLSDAGRTVAHRASSSCDAMQNRTTRLGEMVQSAFRDQPLVGGALAFAAGAAIGAALPRTEQEDAVVGEAASRVRRDFAEKAEAVLDKGNDLVSDASRRVSSVASDVHQAAKDRIGEEYDKMANASESRQSNPPSE